MVKYAIMAIIAIAVLGVAAATAYELSGGSAPQIPHPKGATDCGNVSLRGPSQNYHNTSGQVECFINAYASGKNATLSAFFMGVDVDTTYNLSIVSNASSETVIAAIYGSGPDYFGSKAPAVVRCSSFGYGYNASHSANGILISSCADNESPIFIGNYST
jgi:hypothetical protein